MKKTKILFEGHDLKFLSHVIDHYKKNSDYNVEVFTYSGHEISDLTEVERILPDIDIIFCEWGLGNLRWFSQNKLPGQKIITRIHSQEFFTGYLHETHWSQVSKIVFVSKHMLEKFRKLFPGSSEKCVMIHNMVDCEIYAREKTTDAKYNIGMLGVLPKLKAPHLGLEILKDLKKEDQRYKLFIKSSKPQEVDWIWKKEEEKQYYTGFYQAVTDLGLEDSVIWEPQGNDVADWFTKIGFILSCSDREAFHLAVAEGMASGAIPIIRNWEGSRELFPPKYSFDTVKDAVTLITKFSAPKDNKIEAAFVLKYCKNNFDVKAIVPEFDRLMFPEYDITEVRREFYKVSEQGKILALANEGCEKAKERASGDLNNLVAQQKGLIDNNSTLTAEISLIRTELTKSQETNQRIAVSFDQLQLEYTSIREALNHNLLDVARITNELQEQAMQNIGLREEIISQQHVNQLIKETLSAENSNIRTTLEKEKSMIRESLEKEKSMIRESLEKEKAMIRESLEKENKIIKEMLDKKSDRITMYAKERSVLQQKIDRLQGIILDLERRQAQTYDSLTWKVGAALVKKPADAVVSIRKLLSPRKQAR